MEFLIFFTNFYNIKRSFKESVVLEELRKEGKVEIHFMREGLILNLKSNSVDILR
jgi:hypothetical protein